jgi:hypothetical protein
VATNPALALVEVGPCNERGPRSRFVAPFALSQMKPPSRPGAGQARWVQVATSPIVGFGDDRVATKPALHLLRLAPRCGETRSDPSFVAPNETGRRGDSAVRWVKFAISPIVGFGDDGARAVPHHDGLVRRWVAFLWALAATPFGSFTNETYRTNSPHCTGRADRASRDQRDCGLDIRQSNLGARPQTKRPPSRPGGQKPRKWLRCR